jgi:hypothetical protein
MARLKTNKNWRKDMKESQMNQLEGGKVQQE